jgi:hypothetical protein
MYFVNAFPDLRDQNRRLDELIMTVFQDQVQTDPVVREVDLCAQRGRQMPQATAVLFVTAVSLTENTSQPPPPER